MSKTEKGSAGPDDESWKERGLKLRVFYYIFGTHIIAGFVMLLFYLGQHADK